jgi:hypothetical protein
MSRFSFFIDAARAYAALSPDGRAFLRKQRSKSKKSRTPESVGLLENRASRLSLLRSLKTCDAAFFECVPESVCDESGRRRSSVYARFVPFAWIGLEIRSRLLDAFGISRDESHDRQLILLTFVHREWDDLLEEAQPETLYRILRSPQLPEPRFRLLYHVTAVINALNKQKGLFEKTVEVWDKAMDYYNRPFRDEEAASYLEGKAALNEEIYARTLLPEVPPELSKILRPFYIWFLSLDDAADVERDRARGRTTYMTLAADPVEEIWTLFQRCEETIRRTAPRDPGLLLLLMRSMTADVAAAVRQGRDIERDFYAAPNKPVNRNPSPSSPYRAGPA